MDLLREVDHSVYKYFVYKLESIILIFPKHLQGIQGNDYKVLLKLTGITQDDADIKFKLHVTNEIGDTYYRVMLSG